jgi:UDPglucose--hexose-1-phosphate uridylyltransferase
VAPNKYAAFGPPGAPAESNGRIPATGGHEVVIHGPAHHTTLSELAPQVLPAVLATWRRRLAHWDELGAGAVTIIVNEGPEAGASLEHSHSQVFATGIRPPLVEAEVARLAGDGCAACALVTAERKAGDRVVADAGGLLTVCPWASGMPLESLIVPDDHLARFSDGDEHTDRLVAGALADQVARLTGVLGHEPALNLVLHSAPPGVADFHWHLHVLPRLTVLAGFELGTGMLINVVDPDGAAERLRQAGDAAGV